MLPLYVSVNRRYVETVCSNFTFLYSSVLNFTLWQCCGLGLVGFRHKTTGLGLEEIMFWLKIPVHHKHGWKLSRAHVKNTQFCCCKHSWKIFWPLLQNIWFCCKRHCLNRLLLLVSLCCHATTILLLLMRNSADMYETQKLNVVCRKAQCQHFIPVTGWNLVNFSTHLFIFFLDIVVHLEIFE